MKIRPTNSGENVVNSWHDHNRQTLPAKPVHVFALLVHRCELLGSLRSLFCMLGSSNACKIEEKYSVIYLYKLCFGRKLPAKMHDDDRAKHSFVDETFSHLHKEKIDLYTYFVLSSTSK